jgi:hypothetical protein
MLFAAMHEFLVGTFQTGQARLATSVLEGKANCPVARSDF